MSKRERRGCSRAAASTERSCSRALILAAEASKQSFLSWLKCGIVHDIPSGFRSHAIAGPSAAYPLMKIDLPANPDIWAAFWLPFCELTRGARRGGAKERIDS